MLRQTAKTYCYRQKQFSADFCTFNRSASETSMSCSIFFNLNVLMLHKFAAFAISNLLAFQLIHRDTQARQCLSRRCQPSTTVASEALACLQGIQDTATLRLRAYTPTWSTQWSGMSRSDMLWRQRMIRFQATTSGAHLFTTWQPCIREWNSKTPQRLPKVAPPTTWIDTDTSLLWFDLIAYPRILLCPILILHDPSSFGIALVYTCYMGNLNHHHFKHCFPPTLSEAQRRSLVHLGL